LKILTGYSWKILQKYIENLTVKHPIIRHNRYTRSTKFVEATGFYPCALLFGAIIELL
jgi:hypothetical protein